MADRKITYLRTYDNILDIAGKIGGLMNSLVGFLTIFMDPVVTFMLNALLASKIFILGNETKGSAHKISPSLVVNKINLAIIYRTKFHLLMLQHFDRLSVVILKLIYRQKNLIKKEA